MNNILGRKWKASKRDRNLAGCLPSTLVPSHELGPYRHTHTQTAYNHGSVTPVSNWTDDRMRYQTISQSCVIRSFREIHPGRTSLANIFRNEEKQRVEPRENLRSSIHPGMEGDSSVSHHAWVSPFSPLLSLYAFLSLRSPLIFINWPVPPSSSGRAAECRDSSIFPP